MLGGEHCQSYLIVHLFIIQINLILLLFFLSFEIFKWTSNYLLSFYFFRPWEGFLWGNRGQYLGPDKGPFCGREWGGEKGDRYFLPRCSIFFGTDTLKKNIKTLFDGIEEKRIEWMDKSRAKEDRVPFCEMK